MTRNAHPPTGGVLESTPGVLVAVGPPPETRGMLTPKVTEITRLSAHRSDALRRTLRCIPAAAAAESLNGRHARSARIALGVGR
jgi:hypothetical protein